MDIMTGENFWSILVATLVLIYCQYFPPVEVEVLGVSVVDRGQGRCLARNKFHFIIVHYNLV